MYLRIKKQRRKEMMLKLKFIKEKDLKTKPNILQDSWILIIENLAFYSNGRHPKQILREEKRKKRENKNSQPRERKECLYYDHLT